MPAIQSKEDVNELKRLQGENAALKDKITAMHGEVTEFHCQKAMDTYTTDWKVEFIQTKQELSQMKEAVCGKQKNVISNDILNCNKVNNILAVTFAKGFLKVYK